MVSVFALFFEFLLLYLIRLGGSSIPESFYMIMVFVSTIALMVDLAMSRRIRFARGAILFGYFWRLFLVLFDLYGKSIYKLPNSGADSLMFYRQAVNYVSTGYAGLGGTFSAVMGRVFRITGASQLYGQFLLVLMSVLALCVFARMMAEMDLDYRAKTWSISLLAFLPNFAIISSIFLRECPILTLLALSFFFFYRWMERGSWAGFVLAFGFAMASSTMHGGSAAVAVGYIAVLILYDTERKAFRASAKNIILAIVLSLAMIYLYLNYGDLFFSKLLGVESIEDIGSTGAEGGSSYARYVGDSATPLNMMIYTIPRIVYFLFSPFPWQWRGLSDIIAFVFSGLFYLLAVVHAFHYLRRGDGEHKYLLLAFLIVAAATTFVFAWGVTNTGTAARHREKMVILFGLIYAIGISGKKPTRIVFRSRR